MKKLIIISTIFVLTYTMSNARCYTGFACSLENIETKQLILFKNYIDNYFKKSPKEANYITGKYSIFSYNDLFTFNKLV